MSNSILAFPSAGIRARATATALAPAKQLELMAIFKALSKDEPTAEELALVRDWLASLMKRRSSSVMEFTALLYTQRRAFAARHLPASAALAERALHVSFESLSGRKVERGIVPGLPASVLHAESEEMKIFYETVRAEGLRAPLFRGPAGEFLNRLQMSAFWNFSTLLCALAALAILPFEAGRAILFGLVIGMAGASFNEYTVHLGIGHASDRLMLLYRKLGWGGRYAEEIVLAHRVHHSKMLTDFRVEFTDEKTKRRVDTYLRNEARKMVEGRVADGITAPEIAEDEVKRIISDIRRGGYGVNGTTIGCISMQVLALPYFLVNIALSPVLGGWLFLLVATVTLSAFIAQSMYSHRYLHLSRADQAAARKNGKDSLLMLWFFQSPIGKLQVRRHYRHHHEKIDYARTVNGVIMSFNFADFVMRKGVDEAEIRHLIKMKSEGFL